MTESREGSLRPADARLLFPDAIRRVRLLGDLHGWHAALEKLSLQITDEDPDLVVADAAHAKAAATSHAPNVFVYGGHRRALRSAEYTTSTLLVRQGSNGIRLFVPVEFRRASAHALTSPIRGRPLAKRVLARLAASAVRAGLPMSDVVTVGRRSPGLPRTLQAAAVDATEWYLFTGEGYDEQRLVWFCFDGAAEPNLAVKFGRVPGNRGPFDREENILRQLDVVPDELRRHAPRLFRRFEVDGCAGAVETAAAGQPLHHRLSLAHIDAISEWIVAFGRASALSPTELEAERSRLERDVIPHWNGAPAGLAATLPPIAPVLLHNDLGCWNIVVTPESFMAIDWESGERAGLPLWDLVYFLTDAFSELTEPSDKQAKLAAIFALLRGELDTSVVLFERVRDAAMVAGVPPDAIGPVVTLGWLHHGMSSLGRELDAGPLSRVADQWLRDPRLGLDWRALTASA